LTITVAPSVAGTVFDALDYLTSYPWGCTEQTMSSFLPDLIVAQAVDKLHLKSPIDRKTLNDMVQAGWSGSTASSTTMAAGAGGPTIQSRSS
jgi:alpha-2-macroglobulin